MSWAEDWRNGLDLERLHRNHIERGSGKTMAYIAAMFGEAILGQPGSNYLYVAETYNIKTWVCKDFHEILKHEGISVTPNGSYRYDELYVETTRLFVKGWRGVRTFDFMQVTQLETGCRGKQWDRVFLDVSAPRKIQFEHGIDLLKFCNKDRGGKEYVY